jgi:hypothetical protein
MFYRSASVWRPSRRMVHGSIVSIRRWVPPHGSRRRMREPFGLFFHRLGDVRGGGGNPVRV